MTKQKKTLLFDIESAPLLSYTWGIWEQNVVEVKRDWYILSVAWKWLGESKVHVMSLPQFKNWNKDKEDDSALIKELWKLFDEADVIVAHNGNSFDIKKSNARFIINELKPPSPYKTIDTKLVAKRYFKFDSNKLNELGKYLKLGKKLETGGFELWKGCMNGDKKAWKKMCAYNKQDVVLLEKVYNKLLPWITNHPSDTGVGCPNCGSHDLIKSKLRMTRTGLKQQWQCKDCGAYKTTTVKK